MSRIGLKPIIIPEEVTVLLHEQFISVNGPKGTLTVPRPNQITVTIADQKATLSRKGDDPLARSLHGLTRALLANAIGGVTLGYSKKLELRGIGYRAELQGKNLVLAVGFSHPVTVPVPEDLTATVEKNQITISGISKERVGQLAATVRSIRPPEPYKGKGIRYLDEQIKLKPGKQATKATGTA